MDEELLLHLVQEEGLTVHEIAQMYHVSWRDILPVLEKNGIANPTLW